MTLAPNSELVTVAWLRGVPGIDPSQVSTSRPQDNSTWAGSGFVQVGPMSGQPDVYIPMRRPVASVHLWAVNLNSGKPPWAKAAALGEAILADCQTHEPRDVSDQLPAQYRGARVLSAYAMGEPRRVPGDLTSYAHFVFDLQLHWCEVP
ncbi:MAG TPA: hypothetical protein VFO67_05135 [Gemmatimonadales bacterium]|nr:hypothetical protein [Gemmatimonadales bacterium]